LVVVVGCRTTIVDSLLPDRCIVEFVFIDSVDGSGKLLILGLERYIVGGSTVEAVKTTTTTTTEVNYSCFTPTVAPIDYQWKFNTNYIKYKKTMSRGRRLVHMPCESRKTILYNHDQNCTI